MAARRLLFPALGSPTSPTSAISLSTSSIRRSSPSSPPSPARPPPRGGLVRGGGNRGFAAPALSAAGHQQLLARLEHFAEQRAALRVLHHGPRGHRQVKIVSGSAGPGLPFA